MRISFDFDRTLDTSEMQALASKFIAMGAEVWITSSRPLGKNPEETKSMHPDLFEVATQLSIQDRVQLTNYEPKHDFLSGFDLHFDDDVQTVNFINADWRGCVGVLFGRQNIMKRL